MKSDTMTVQQIFQERRQYRVPFYQRAYVWNRADQWERLWEDIRDKAEARLEGASPTPHFMGAVVLEPQPRKGLIGVERFYIIDGQQRLTTLQYALTALAHSLRAQGLPILQLVESCITNPHPATMEDAKVERFKVWPTFRDQERFRDAMTATDEAELQDRFPDSFKADGDLRKKGVDHPAPLEAIWFFWTEFHQWLVSGDASPSRAEALATAVLCDLSVVCISLGEQDDAQVIFETLNGHGAQLHATDLIRNFIFMRAGDAAAQLYEDLWSRFEDHAWTTKQTRGRLNKPRIEWFVQTVLQVDTGAEVDVGRLYASYRTFAGNGPSGRTAAQQLEILTRYAEPYLELVTGDGDTPVARFGRQMAPWEASTTHTIALRIATSNAPTDVQRLAFADLESYFVRRAICGLSTKYYNRVLVQLLRRITNEGTLAEDLHRALAELKGNASRWPTDEEFRKSWLEDPIFPGHLEVGRMRAILVRLEAAMRSHRSEEKVVSLDENLDVEHILPTSWYEHWALPDGSFATERSVIQAQVKAMAGTATEDRDAQMILRNDCVPRMGNLTLLHQGVNRGLQNRNFTEKRTAYFANSNLQLNRGLMLRAIWDEHAIAERSREMFDLAQRLWPGPRPN